MCGIAFSVLCIVLTLINYFSFRNMLFGQYDDHLKNVLKNTACEIDVDDLAECIRTGQESEAYHRLQKELDMRKDNTDLHFLYIIIPLNTEPVDNIQNVIAAMSRTEYEEHPEYMVSLNSLTGDSYSPHAAAKYLKAYETGELSYFENVTEFGDDYTALLPLYDSKGNKVAALCVDVEMDEIRSLLFRHCLTSGGITLLAGFIITLLFLKWVSKNIVQPIEVLDQSVYDYMDKGLDSTKPESLLFSMPDVHTGNEVESLARRIVLMSEAMCVSVTRMLNTQAELDEMNIVAHRDALTHVGNKTAYKKYIAQLEQSISAGSAEFAVVMADVNRLKYVNDTFGHEKGDIYISTCCSVICGVYKHSPVFRVGGDEFVIFLTGQDYEHRDTLLNTIKKRLSSAHDAADAEPWTATSVALGMAAFDPEKDTEVQQVVTRADEKMYRNKVRMHQAREV